MKSLRSHAPLLLILIIIPVLVSCQVDQVSNDPVDGWAVLAQKDYYSDVDMSDLAVEYIDNTRMRQALEKSGWKPDQIHELREFDQASLKAELDWLEANADKNDIVFLYVTSHGEYLSKEISWREFVPDEWSQISSQRRLLIVDSCTAAKFTNAIASDARPHLSVAAVDSNELGWKGLEEEGLPIIGGVFTYYFVEALENTEADANEDGRVSVQEAVLMAESQQRDYMHEIVFAVPEFVEMYHVFGVAPERDPTYPDVIMDDAIGEPLFLTLDSYP